jgi:predicted CXXCH cytochrome family protein
MKRWCWIALMGAAAAWSVALMQSPLMAAQNSGPLVATAPMQPVPFNHKLHTSKQIDCLFCHAPSRSGETLKIPQAEFCMQCHASIATDSPGVQRLAAFAKASETIPWVRVYELPSFVYFSHKTHLAQNITCQKCHGQIANRTATFKEADISMATCVECHQQKKANTGCDTCHTLEK